VSQELQPVASSTAIAAQDELSIEQLVGMVGKVQEAMRRVMRSGEDYGVIPGTGSKPTLLKPGAEKLCMLFRLSPELSVEEEREGDHRTYRVTCDLKHIGTGRLFARAVGSCSTRESKYAWRKAGRKCPKCGAESIIKGKAEYGGGFLCFAKKGGCGAKFADHDPAITSQTEGRVENPDLPDTWNTVLKMASKRATVAAVLLGTGASAIFTQDVEDFRDETPAPTEDMMPRESAPPQSGPTSVINPGEVVVRILAVEEHPGTNAKTGKPFIRYGVKVDNGGAVDILGTFSDTDAKIARDLIGKDAAVSVKSREVNGKTYFDLEGVRSV
jgi:hypothetical protein